MSRFPFPFYTPFSSRTSGVSNEVPGKYMVALSGRGFLVDIESGGFSGQTGGGRFRHESIPLLRTQADQSGRPGESSINPEDLWRRTASSWHKGAGQRNFDIETADSDPARFYRSRGIDPWTKGQINLLPQTVAKGTTSNTNLFMVVAGSYLYFSDGIVLKYTQDVTGASTWTATTVTGSPSAVTGLTSDGYTIYSAHNTDGIYTTTRGAATTASYATGTVTGVRYIKGRLFAWTAGSIYNVIGAGALPSVLLAQPNSDFKWVDVAEGPGFYFLAGYSGDKSTIYKCAVKADGTGLDTPTVAGQLPDGEIVRSVFGYLGFVLLGTDKGVRFAVPDASGNITIGGLIDQASNVLCFEGQDRFVWFGWPNFDATTAGLGRMDLSAFNGSRPAFASDLMRANAGNLIVSSVVTFQKLRVFAVEAGGWFAESSTLLEPTGYLEQGRISYGLYEPKVSMFVTASHEPLNGTVEMLMSANGALYVDIGGLSTLQGEVRSNFPTEQARAETFELKIVLTPNGPLTAGPVIARFTLRAYPVAARSQMITVPLMIAEHQTDLNGSRFQRDIAADIAFLEDLETAGSVFTYQEGVVSKSVVMQDHTFMPHHAAASHRGFEGTYVAELKEFPRE